MSCVMALHNIVVLRSSIRGTSSIFNSFRKHSTTGPSINLAVNEKTGFTTLTLQKPPVNSLSLEFLTEISTVLTELEKNKCRGLIVTSSSNNVFSAGLDLLELYKPDIDRFKRFWTAMQQTWIKLYGTSYPTVAVINGHAPAGGCLLALSCEYRIMLNNFTIGLNETQVGIVAPQWLINLMTNTIGFRQSELALTSGNLFKTDEALQIGLIDEAVSSKEEGLARAEKFLQRFARIPPLARAATKQALRGAEIKKLVDNQQEDLNSFLNSINQEKVQEGIGLYLEGLKQKKKQ